MTEVATLGNLASQGRITFNDGYRTKASELGTPGIPILRVAEVQDGSIAPSFRDFVREEFRGSIGPKTSRPGDVIVTTKGTVGRVAQIPIESPEFVYSPQLCYFRTAPNSGIDSRFLYYWFRGPEFRAQAAGVQGQTDMAPYINLADMRNLTVTLPSFPEQRAVVDVLGPLDEKIESSRRLVTWSQDLADLMFAAWSRDTSDWDEATFGDFADVFGGSTPSTTESTYWDGQHPWATPTDVTALWAPYLFDTHRHITDTGLASASTALHPSGTIFMTSRATIGAFAVAQIPSSTNQGFIVVRPRRENHRWFLFHEMKGRVPEMLDRANGSTFMEISRGTFKAMTLSVPTDRRRLDDLHDRLDPIHARAAAAARECTALAVLRDALMPELFSGRVRVRSGPKSETFE